jgi:hypothetical protein
MSGVTAKGGSDPAAWPPAPAHVDRFKRDVSVVVGSFGIDPVRAITWERDSECLLLVLAAQRRVFAVPFARIARAHTMGYAPLLAAVNGGKIVETIKGVARGQPG